MDNGLIIAAVLMAGLLACHLLLSNWLLARVQPVRLRMADRGCELLASEHLPERMKLMVQVLMKDAFDPYFMLYAARKIPVTLLRGKWRNSDWIERIEDRATRESFVEFLGCHFQSAAAANPLCALIVGVEMAVGVLAYMCVGILVSLPDALFAATVQTEKALQHA